MMSKALRARIVVSEKEAPIYVKDRIAQIHANLILRRIEESPFKDEKEEILEYLKMLR